MCWAPWAAGLGCLCRDRGAGGLLWSDLGGFAAGLQLIPLPSLFCAGLCPRQATGVAPSVASTALNPWSALCSVLLTPERRAPCHPPRVPRFSPRAPCWHFLSALPVQREPDGPATHPERCPRILASLPGSAPPSPALPLPPPVAPAPPQLGLTGPLSAGPSLTSGASFWCGHSWGPGMLLASGGRVEDSPRGHWPRLGNPE